MAMEYFAEVLFNLIREKPASSHPERDKQDIEKYPEDQRGGRRAGIEGKLLTVQYITGTIGEIQADGGSIDHCGELHISDRFHDPEFYGTFFCETLICGPVKDLAENFR